MHQSFYGISIFGPSATMQCFYGLLLNGSWNCVTAYKIKLNVRLSTCYHLLHETICAWYFVGTHHYSMWNV